jgi:hypothetical protein
MSAWRASRTLTDKGGGLGTRHRAKWCFSLTAVAWGILICSAVPPCATAATDPERIHWKQVDEAQVKLDDKIPLTWNIYQSEKKKASNLVLVLLGHRYLMVDIKAKLVYWVAPSDLQSQGKDFESDELSKPSQVIPSTDWTEHDVGPAESIQLTLGDYGRILQIELPHPLDLRRGIY